ncbi:undecaprenyldiphospho-muramoylpentapeptide beta-N-acetylglucosaminyltransferase [Flavimarina sp. Hel_I_48]|uniref:undecaprenyldiphospho-muramoylpentapeptide beta-N-acetylglucosaminyltransferase n=1 Tax=Flavimarina sp. Hel_I_48 TaxID=1392488 RepID=UPI0004DFB9B0|nr:undecaprenyldiphospho-muramoylpentapeptide beta-N-acetylglucosaminyltransferase [Flavimarina sp. Hel_I_48]
MKPYRFIISGGGTGGHIYPALAIADGLKVKYPDAEFLFVGARDRMEMEKVPQAGYTIKGLWITGIKRELTLSNLMFPLKLISSLLASVKIIKTFKPDVVIGTGGFASGPLLQAANSKNIPTLIQEQNSYAGVTNKLLSKKAKKICVAYDNMQAFFPKEKIVKTGNPVRQDLLEINDKRRDGQIKFRLEEGKQTLLVLGGSLGARAINAFVSKNLDYILAQGVQVIWQTGKLYYEQYKENDTLENVTVLAYIDTMNLAYAAADLIISRAGAGSVSELCIVGKPVIFIPSPNVAEDHQTKNAQAIATKDAAILLAEKELETQFKPIFDELVKNPEKRRKLGENINKLALPHATDDIIEEVEKMILRKE